MKKNNERFANKVILIIGIATALFTIGMIAVYLITGQEMTVLTESWFSIVVGECGLLMLKRIAEIITERIQKKEKLKKEDNEDEY